jgi:signal transduction histidine kinase
VAHWQDNAHLALADAQSVQIWDLEKNALLFDEPMQIAATVLFRPETKSMFASSRTGLFRWPVSQDAVSGIAVGKREVLTRPQRGGFFERCAISPEGDFLAVVGGTEALVLNLADPGKPLRLRKTPSALVQVAVGPQARWVAAGTWKGWGMGIWDGQTGELLRKLSDENCAINFSRDGSMLAVSTPSGYSIYETTNWSVRFHVPSQVAGVVPGAINFNRDGTLLAVSPGIPPIHLVDPQSGRLLGKLTPPNIKNVSWIDVSPDGRQLAAATDHANVDVWNLETLGKELAALNLGWYLATTNAPRTIPALASAVASSVTTTSRGRVTVPMIGVGLALLLAAITIGYHRRWLAHYDQVEDLATQRQRELVRTQGELMQSQKMQALGTLAAGIAHDFNNLLSVIRLSNDFLKRGVKGDPDLAEETEAITRAVHQGKSVVNSMLGYTRSQQDDPAPVNVCEIVEELVAMLSHQFLAGVQLTVDLDKEAPLVEAPRSALQQVLLNLVVNACEAMKFRGKLRISVTVAESAPASGLVKSPQTGSQYVILTVADNGPGMSREIQARIFEPFFTTKQMGASPGRGLGLSTVYMVAEQEGLGLRLETAPQQGAVFQIFIPAPAPQ